MPIFQTRIGPCYFAHVPKCGGSSVEEYLRVRFGRPAFLDKGYMGHDRASRWSVTSPQHIDWVSLNRLFPPGHFAAVFAVVRHPVSRLVSDFHFQIDVEKTVAPDVPFSDWLSGQVEALRDNPFADDNHRRPQCEFMGEDAQIFHLEHGLDAIVPWLDALTGEIAGPRAIGHDNRQSSGARVTPSASDLARIAEVYAGDFRRFGYRIGEKMPDRPKPELGRFAAEAAAARAAASRFVPRLKRRIKRRLRKWLD
jgi:hypothetical protein